MLRYVFPLMVFLLTYKAAHWRYLQLNNPNFFFSGIVSWHSSWFTALNWQRLYQSTPNLRNGHLKVQTSIAHNNSKIHGILLLWEKFVRSAFFELIWHFTPGIWCGGSNTPGMSREPEPVWILEKLSDPHKLWKFERNRWNGMCHACPVLSSTDS